MPIITAVIIAGIIDITGRLIALSILMQNGNVKHLKYRTWVLLCALVNFAWVFYLIMGRGKKNV